MPDAAPIVFVVDNERSVCNALESLIPSSAGWRVEAFASARAFLARPRSTVPCCLVLDVILPDSNGLDLQARVASERREMPIIFAASCRDVPTIVRAMKAGALEFLSTPYDDNQLLSAIRVALEHSRVTLAHEAEQTALRERFRSLTRREREVMTLIVTGRLNKQVGGRLGISELTVKAHRGQVMRKMLASSFAHLVDMARALGLTLVPEAGAAPGRRPPDGARAFSYDQSAAPV